MKAIETKINQIKQKDCQTDFFLNYSIELSGLHLSPFYTKSPLDYMIVNLVFMFTENSRSY